MFRLFLSAVLIAGLALPAVAEEVFFFTDHQEFELFNMLEGKTRKGLETFEESNIPPGGKQPLPAPLEGNVTNVDPITGYGFPEGLSEKNIIIQDNIWPGFDVGPAQPNPPQPMPSGDPAALYVIGPGFLDANSIKVGEDLGPLHGTPASLDLIFTTPNHTGVGFWLSRFAGFPLLPFHITIYDKNDFEIGKFFLDVTAVEPAKFFFGVWSADTIGRINVYDDFLDPSGAIIVSPSAVDDIEMWVPEPGTLALVVGGALIGLRRRRIS